MDFLASCSVEESSKYNGKLVVPAEDGGKPGKVMLNIVSSRDDRSLVKLIGGNVKCITYTGEMSSFAEDSFEDMPAGVFHEVQLDDFDVQGTPKYNGVVTLLRLPDGYCDMRSLYNICSARDDVRVVGGNLLGIDGVRVGRFEAGKDKYYPVFDGVYDSFLEVSLSDLGDVTELIKKAKKKVKSSSTEEKPKKERKAKESSPKRAGNKLSTSFSCLFSESDVEEF